MDMKGVRSEPDLYRNRMELYNPLQVEQITKPRRAQAFEVITGNEFMRRDLGIQSYFKPSEGSIFDYNKFDEALKDF